MSSLNKVSLIGNVGQDPEVKGTSNGKRLASFSLATSDSWKDGSGQRQERTEWHKVVVYNDGLVGVIERYVKKGSKVYIEGKLQTRKWSDSNGVERYTTEVVLQNYQGQLIMLGGKDVGGSGGGGGGDSYHGKKSRGGGASLLADDDFDDVPF